MKSGNEILKLTGSRHSLEKWSWLFGGVYKCVIEVPKNLTFLFSHLAVMIRHKCVCVCLVLHTVNAVYYNLRPVFTCRQSKWKGFRQLSALFLSDLFEHAHKLMYIHTFSVFAFVLLKLYFSDDVVVSCPSAAVLLFYFHTFFSEKNFTSCVYLCVQYLAAGEQHIPGADDDSRLK